MFVIRGARGQVIAVGAVGKANPVIPVVREGGRTITFSCPTCAGEISVRVSKIDDRRGVLWGCKDFCQDNFHIQGRKLQRKERDGVVITSGVVVAIENFGEWFTHHPTYVALGEESWMLNEHGLWAFCAACGGRTTSTVLCAFVNYQLCKSLGMLGYVFGASSDESAREMEALRAGGCQRCRSKALVAIMTNIPEYLREDYRARRACQCQ